MSARAFRLRETRPISARHVELLARLRHVRGAEVLAAQLRSTSHTVEGALTGQGFRPWVAARLEIAIEALVAKEERAKAAAKRRAAGVADAVAFTTSLGEVVS